MALNTSQLTGPGDVRPETVAVSQPPRAQTWDVGNPMASAMAGLSTQLGAFADTYDDVVASNFLIDMRQEMDRQWFHPETGLFNVRKGLTAQGLYNDFVVEADGWVDRSRQQLSGRQQRLVNEAMTNTFIEFGHEVGSFETTEVMQGQVNLTDTALSNLVTLMASGQERLSPDALGFALSQIQILGRSKARMEGWDEATQNKFIRDTFGDTVLAGVTALASSDAEQAQGMLRTFADSVPADKLWAAARTLHTKFEDQVTEGVYLDILNNDYAAGIARVDSYTVSNRSRGFTIQAESNNNPAAVSPDGKAFGLYQWHVNSGLTDLINWLPSHGGADAAADLIDARTYGTLPETWKRLVSEGKLTDEMQHQAAQSLYFDAALAKMPPDLQRLMANNPQWASVLWDTSIMHGVGGATRILTNAWRVSGGDTESFITAVTEARRADYKDSAAYPRFDRLAQQFLAGREYGEAENLLAPVLTASKAYSLYNLLETSQARQTRDLQDMLQNNSDEALWNSMMLGDNTMLDMLTAQVQTKGTPQEFAEWQDFVYQNTTLQDSMLEFADQSVTDQQHILRNLVNNNVSGSAYYREQIYTQQENLIFQRAQAMAADPAGYYAQLQERKRQVANRGLPQDRQMPPAVTLDEALHAVNQPERSAPVEFEQQSAPGFDPVAQFRTDNNSMLRAQAAMLGTTDVTHLPVGVADGYKAQLSNPENFQTALAQAVSLAKVYGSMWAPEVLQELGLTASQSQAVQFYNEGVLSEAEARELFAAGSGLVAVQLPENVKLADVRAQVEQNPMIQSFLRQARLAPASSATNEAQELLDAFTTWSLMPNGAKKIEALVNKYDYAYTDQAGWGGEFSYDLMVRRGQQPYDTDSLIWGLGRMKDHVISLVDLPSYGVDSENDFIRTSRWVTTQDGNVMLVNAGGVVLSRSGQELVFRQSDVTRGFVNLRMVGAGVFNDMLTPALQGLGEPVGQLGDTALTGVGDTLTWTKESLIRPVEPVVRGLDAASEALAITPRNVGRAAQQGPLGNVGRRLEQYEMPMPEPIQPFNWGN